VSCRSGRCLSRRSCQRGAYSGRGGLSLPFCPARDSKIPWEESWPFLHRRRSNDPAPASHAADHRLRHSKVYRSDGLCSLAPDRRSTAERCSPATPRGGTERQFCLTDPTSTNVAQYAFQRHQKKLSVTIHTIFHVRGQISLKPRSRKI
jgi:hypothetical protein